MRLVAVQRWPVVPNPPQSPPSMASSRFASSSTIIGFLPPNSSEQCLKLLAALVPTIRPTAVDPVSEIARTSGCSVSGPPTCGPKPVTIFTTPRGRPASLRVRPRLKVESGVSCAGLITHVFPHTIAGSSIHIRFAGLLKDADQIARVSRIAIFESLSGRGLHPFAINEVLVNLGSSAGSDHGGAGHSVRCHKASSKLSRSIYATGPDETQQ